MIVAIAASAGGSSEYVPEKNAVFKLSLTGTLVEQAVKNPFSELMGESSSQVAVQDVIKAIRRAKTNENIKRQAITNAYDFDISKNLEDWTTDENLLKELLNI